jgi:N utilization substance protein A
MAAIVDDDQLSLAIGKSGQNARLAAQLTGWKVDILTDTRFAEIQQEKTETRIALSELAGVGKVMQTRLTEYGFGSANDIAESTLERLIIVPGLGEATAEKMYKAAKVVVDEKVTIYREEVRVRKEAEAAKAAEQEAFEKAAAEALAAAKKLAAEEASAAEALAAEQAAAEATDESEASDASDSVPGSGKEVETTEVVASPEGEKIAPETLSGSTEADSNKIAGDASQNQELKGSAVESTDEKSA